MSLTVETGLNVANSEAYISVTDADMYFSNRGNATWAALGTPAKEQALRKSTDFMLERYRSKWGGYRKYSSQSLDWPRSQVEIRPIEIYYPTFVDDTIVPTEVQRACAELALRASTGDLYPDVTDLITKETIGPITVEYDKRSPVSPQYKSVDAMLSPYLKNGGMNGISFTSQRA